MNDDYLWVYGKYTQYKKFNTTRVWCQTCDPELIPERWTSGNEDVDYCIKNFQYLGLSKKTDWKDLESLDLFGVLPYIAPKVLKTNQYTQAADIYGFGVIL
ncbi:hypothetical protein C2G38_2038845 [Gigaspora rosea]|uniref:Protein kinase domain-containing protein n=1 Tax=Gigaspora rosea TaxID=44941 RepID=A0A397V2E3_9GLOM|nr:hypothetical protein C2G38_2038845 [Gigaspora rosea]